MGRVTSWTEKEPGEGPLSLWAEGFPKAQLEGCCQKEEMWVLGKEQPVWKCIVSAVEWDNTLTQGQDASRMQRHLCVRLR